YAARHDAAAVGRLCAQGSACGCFTARAHTPAAGFAYPQNLAQDPAAALLRPAVRRPPSAVAPFCPDLPSPFRRILLLRAAPRPARDEMTYVLLPGPSHPLLPRLGAILPYSEGDALFARERSAPAGIELSCGLPTRSAKSKVPATIHWPPSDSPK